MRPRSGTLPADRVRYPNPREFSPPEYCHPESSRDLSALGYCHIKNKLRIEPVSVRPHYSVLSPPKEFARFRSSAVYDLFSKSTSAPTEINLQCVLPAGAVTRFSGTNAGTEASNSPVTRLISEAYGAKKVVCSAIIQYFKRANKFQETR